MLLEALSLMFGMEPQVDILKSQLAAQLIKNCEISAGPTFQNSTRGCARSASVLRADEIF